MRDLFDFEEPEFDRLIKPRKKAKKIVAESFFSDDGIVREQGKNFAKKNSVVSS
jgi:hypothetical protein